MQSFRPVQMPFQTIQGYEGLKKALESLKDKNVVVYFRGAKSQDGQNWCPDCRKCESNCVLGQPSTQVTTWWRAR